MLLLKRIIFIAVFLIVWAGSMFLYALDTSGTPKESIFGAISVFWLVVFLLLARKVFKKQPIDLDTATTAGVAQMMGTDSFYDVDFDY